MITLNASGSSVTFTFDGNSTYLNDGTITVPKNSLALIIDESDMATFRKAASNDIFVSANIAEFGMTKDELIAWYKANMVSSGGGGGGVTPEEVEEMIDEAISGITVSGVTEEELNEAIASAKTEIEAEIPTVPTSNTAFTNDAGYITSSALNGYATEDYVTASTSTKLDVSTFETYSGNVETALNGKQPIGDYVTSSQMSAFTYDKATIDEKISEGGIFDPTQYYTTAQTYSKTEANSLLDEKLDATAYTPTDLSNYDTKSEVNTKIEQATSGKVDTSTFNVYSGNVASALDGKVDDAEIADMATKTWVGNQGYITEHQDISGKLDVSTFTAYSGAVDTTINSKASQASVDALNGVVTAHTANTEIHVTGSDKAAWNAKSDFSGSYNDLTDKPTIPTVPTSNTAFTNDAGYITSGEAQTQIDNSISGKVDTTTYTAYTASTDAALSGKVDADFDNSLGFDINDDLGVYAEGNGEDIVFNTASSKVKEYTFPSVYTNGSDNYHKVGFNNTVSLELNQSFSGTVSATQAIGVKYLDTNDELKECWWDYNNNAFTINSDYSANNSVRLTYSSSTHKITLSRQYTSLKTIVTIMVGGDYYIASSSNPTEADCYISYIKIYAYVKKLQSVLNEKQRQLTAGDGIKLDYYGNISANIKVTGDTYTNVLNSESATTSFLLDGIKNVDMWLNQSYTGTPSGWYTISVQNLDNSYDYYLYENDTFTLVSGSAGSTLNYDSSTGKVSITCPSGIAALKNNSKFAPADDLTNADCFIGLVSYTSNEYTIQEAIDNKQDTLSAGTGIEISGNVISATGGGGGGITSGEVQTMIDESISGKVDSTSIVTAVTSASTDSEIPTAKAVFDAIPSGGGGSTYTAGTGIDITNDVISVKMSVGEPSGYPYYSSLNPNATGTTTSERFLYNILGSGYKPLFDFNNARNNQTSKVGYIFYDKTSTTTVSGHTGYGVLIRIYEYNSTNVLYHSNAIIDWKNKEIFFYNKSSASFDTSIVKTIWDYYGKNSILLYTEPLWDDEGMGGQYALDVSNQSGWDGTILNSFDRSDSKCGAYKFYQNANSYSLSSTVYNHAKLTENNLLMINDVNAALGGLKLQQISQADYDALVSGGTVDSSTLYVII